MTDSYFAPAGLGRLILPVGGIGHIQKPGVFRGGKLDLAALGNENYLAWPGGDGAGLGVDGERSLYDVVNFIIREVPGEGGVLHDHESRPQAGALRQGQKVVGPHPVPGIASVQPVRICNLDLGQVQGEHLGPAHLFQQNGADGLFKLGSCHGVSLL